MTPHGRARDTGPPSKSSPRPIAAPGPTVKLDQPLPCGCRVSRDAGTACMRMWFCGTHLAAFEMLEALRGVVSTLDPVVKASSPEGLPIERAKEMHASARAVVAKARGSEWW